MNLIKLYDFHGSDASFSVNHGSIFTIYNHLIIQTHLKVLLKKNMFFLAINKSFHFQNKNTTTNNGKDANVLSTDTKLNEVSM